TGVVSTVARPQSTTWTSPKAPHQDGGGLAVAGEDVLGVSVAGRLADGLEHPQPAFRPGTLFPEQRLQQPSPESASWPETAGGRAACRADAPAGCGCCNRPVICGSSRKRLPAEGSLAKHRCTNFSATGRSGGPSRAR